MKYFLGLDNGGTTTKAAIYDREGKEICVASVETKMIVPAPGFVERDMDEMWEANCTVTRNALEKSGIDPADIAGVGICGHGKGLYLWGKDNRPLRNGIISTDNRAWKYTENWRKDGTESEIAKLSCQKIMSCQPVAILAWLRDHEPECMDKIQWIFEAKDYVRFRLTGEAGAEYGDSSGANFLNLHTRDYDMELLKLFGLEQYRDALPPLCEAAKICGQVTEEAAEKCGLLAGTPVIGGLFDIQACMLAANVLTEEELCMIAGTWSVELYLSQTPVVEKKFLEYIRNTFFLLPEYYLVEVGTAASAGNNEWFVRELLPELKAQAKAEGRSIYEIMNGWVEEIPAKELCPIFLPYLFESNVHPHAKSCFVGMTSFHTRKHLVRSVYEGIAFTHRLDLEHLLVSRADRPKVIRLTGGVAKSKVWTQIFADVMNLPIEIVDVNETGALGCAIAAATATGEYRDMKEAASKMSRITTRVEPIPENVAIYNKKYDLYRKTADALNSVWDVYQDLEDNGL